MTLKYTFSHFSRYENRIKHQNFKSNVKFIDPWQMLLSYEFELDRPRISTINKTQFCYLRYAYWTPTPQYHDIVDGCVVMAEISAIVSRLPIPITDDIMLSCELPEKYIAEYEHSLTLPPSRRGRPRINNLVSG